VGYRTRHRRRAGYGPAGQRIIERVLVDDLGARDVDEDAVGFMSRSSRSPKSREWPAEGSVTTR